MITDFHHLQNFWEMKAYVAMSAESANMDPAAGAVARFRIVIRLNENRLLNNIISEIIEVKPFRTSAPRRWMARNRPCACAGPVNSSGLSDTRT
jgi:hypothetical protein